MTRQLLHALAAAVSLATAAMLSPAAEEKPSVPTAAAGRALLANEARQATTTNAVSTNLLSTNAAGTNLAFSAQGTNAPAGQVKYTSGWGQKLKEGGTTALVQLGLSVFGAGFIFERFFRLRRRYVVPEGLARRARELWNEGKFAELEKLGETDPSTLARVISFITKNRTSPMLEVSEICGDIVTRELSNHYQRAYPLGIVATLEPLLGLLGMILGMIETFETVALAGALGDATQLASGISEALVTTGLGLAIAIPFLALYHVFKHKTTGFGALLEEEVTNLLSEWLMKREGKQ
ncbi:MAG: MotA/TolQ/ExbB proton channel family protein [Verrucomicrobia bacterium]|nr:MotA/TolQ/ExbB proton channel family protein [Verrucomicrobiota bacterium]